MAGVNAKIQFISKLCAVYNSFEGFRTHFRRICLAKSSRMDFYTIGTGPSNTLDQFRDIEEWLVSGETGGGLVYPLGALAVFSVKRWGWYLFLGCSAILIGYNLFVFILSPRYNILLLVLFNLALSVVAGVLFRKHVIAPYFNPRLRWWATEPRYKIQEME